MRRKQSGGSSAFKKKTKHSSPKKELSGIEKKLTGSPAKIRISSAVTNQPIRGLSPDD